MKYFFIAVLLTLLFSNSSFADSTTVKICYTAEIGVPEYTTINKEINRFDSSGRLKQNENYTFEFQSWNQVDTDFHLTTRTDYGYNASGIIDTMLQTHVSNNSTYYFRFNYLYDTSGNLIEKLQFYGINFPLDSSMKTIYQYDSNNNLILQREDQYVPTQLFWTSTLFTWTYDSQDRNIENRTINYQYNNPHDSLVDTYTYSATDKILSKKEVGYSIFVDSTYYDYLYDVNDSLVKYTYYGDATSTAWIPSRTYEYSFIGDSTIEMRSNCPDTTCSDTMTRITTVHDSSWNMINSSYEEYVAGSFWDLVEYETQSFNSSGNVADYYSHQWGGGCSTEEHTTYDYNSSDDLVHTNTYRYHCNEFITDCYYYNLDSDSMLVRIDYRDTTCGNLSVPFAMTVEGGTRPYQYNWTPGNYLSDSTVIHPAITNFDTTLTYSLIATDVNGITAADSMKLFGYPNQFVPINIIPYGIPCENNSFQLIMDTVPLNFTFHWISPNGSYFINDTIDADYSGNYHLYLNDTNGCQYSYLTNENLFSQPSISLGTDTTVCLNDTVILNAGNFVQYAWNTGDVSQTIEVYSPSPSIDTFFVYVTDVNGCTNSDTISVSSVVCLGQNSIFTSGIIVTASRNKILVELPLSIPSAQFALVDIAGRVVINMEIHDHQLIDTSNLQMGVYVYHVENYSGKIVKTD